jgi:uncharacterized cupredoxin-like copper-binding protein
VNVTRPLIRLLVSGAIVAIGLTSAACETRPGGGTAATPSIVAGSSGAPREVNLITRDYAFVPDVLDLVPGETVLLHVINGGLVIHEAVIGDGAVQDAWEAAEAAVAGAPPGPTPVVNVPADVAGVRLVVASGQRVDLTWTVPADAAEQAPGDGAGSGWVVGCHIPGHWARGMQIPVRWVSP